MLKLENWMIVDLSVPCIVGEVDHRNGYTRQLLLIKDNYAVTTDEIYLLGQPDKVWIKTQDAQEKLAEHA